MKLLRAVGLILVGLMPSAAAQLPRIAVADFTTEENSYRAEVAARDFSTALQALVADLPGVEWVERAQLAEVEKEHGLAALGFSDPDRSLKLGKWARADLLLTGWFHDKTSTNQLLRLELIDLGRATTLFSTNTVVAVPPFADPTSLLSHLQPTGDWLKGGLPGTIEAWEAAKSVPVAATLFFDYRGSSFRARTARFRQEHHRLTGPIRRGVEEALEKQLNVRFTSLERPSRAAEESALVATGLVDGSAPGSPRIETLVWGGFTEHGVVVTGLEPGQAQTNLIIRFDLKVWNGSSNFRQVSHEISANDSVREIVDRFTSTILDQLPKTEAAPPMEEAEAFLGKLTYERAKGLMSQFFRPWSGTSEEFEAVDEILRMLEFTMLVDPRNREAREDWLFFRWDFDFMQASGNRFRFAWKAAEAWAEHVDRFGSGTLHNHSASFNQPEGNRWGSRFVAVNHLLTPIRVLEVLRFDSPAYGVPRDAGAGTIRGWRNHWGSELARRLSASHDEADIVPFAGRIMSLVVPEPGATPAVPDSRTVARLIHTLWPTYVEGLRREGATNVPGKLADWIRLALKANGELDDSLLVEAAAKLNQDEPKPRVLVQLPHSGEILSRRFETRSSPTFELPRSVTRVPSAAYRRLSFPDGIKLSEVKRVADLWGHIYVLADTLDQSTRRRGEAERASEWRAQGEKRTEIWELNVTNREMARVSIPSVTNTVSDFCVAFDRLWLAVPGLPLVSYDPATAASKIESAPDGFPARQAHQIAASGSRIVVAADSGDLYLREFPGPAWKRLALAMKPSERATRFAISGDWLVGRSQDYFFARLHTDHQIPFGARLLEDRLLLTLRVPGLNCLAPDGRGGCWVGTSAGLHRISPASDMVENWHVSSDVQQLHVFGQELRHPGSFGFTKNWRESLPDDLARARKHLSQLPTTNTSNSNPLDPISRIPGPVLDIAVDRQDVWLTASTQKGLRLLRLNPRSGLVLSDHLLPWAARLHLVTHDTLWFSGRINGGDAIDLFSISRDLLLLDEKASPLELSNTERSEWLASLPRLEQAVHAYLGGDDRRALDLLDIDDLLLADELELAIAGLCLNRDGLNEPVRAGNYLGELSRRVISGPLAEFAREQLSLLTAALDKTR